MMNMLAAEPTPRSKETTERLSGAAVRRCRRIWRTVWKTWAAVSALIGVAVALAGADAYTAGSAAGFALGAFIWVGPFVWLLLKRDARTAQLLARDGIASEAQVTGRWRPTRYRPAGIDIAWSDGTRTARFEINDPDLFVPPNVTVLSGRDRWVAIVLEDGRLLLGKQPFGAVRMSFRLT